MKYLWLTLFCLFGLAPAKAQNVPLPDDAVKAEWQLYQGQQGHLATSIQILIMQYQALKAENEKLKADAKAKEDPHGQP